MEDKQIIDLYFDRNERAISETGKKYGAFCHRIAMNILCIQEDAEECVNKSVKTLSQKLYRLRKSLKSDLEKKGVAL